MTLPAGSPLRSYTLRRLLAAVLVIVGVAIAAFVLLHVVPGDPARAVLGLHAPNSAVRALRRQWGLDASLPSQFVTFIRDLVTVRLGDSYFYHESVAPLIGQRVGQTAALVAIATVFAVLLSVPLAAVAAARRDRLADHAVRGVSVIGLGMPSFWIGIVLIEIFAVRFRILPVGGWGSTFPTHLESLMLPGLTAALAIVPILVRSLRVGMLEVLQSDFIAAARAKGLGETRVLLAHAARNAVIPTLTLLGLNIAFLVGSTVVVEQVFALNGLGSLLLDSITNRDYPVVQGITVVLATAVVLINLGTELDPASASRRGRLLRAARTFPSLTIGLVLFIVLLTAFLLAPVISPDAPNAQDLTAILQGPSWHHPLGSDELGRDELSRLLFAGRTDLQVGLLAVLFPFCFGTVIGTLAGYYGGLLDGVVMRIVDVLVAFPTEECSRTEVSLVPVAGAPADGPRASACLHADQLRTG